MNFGQQGKSTSLDNFNRHNYLNHKKHFPNNDEFCFYNTCLLDAYNQKPDLTILHFTRLYSLSYDVGRVKVLEEEQEMLNSSLIALTTHFAQVGECSKE